MKKRHVLFISLGIISSVTLGAIGTASFVQELPLQTQELVTVQFFNYDGSFLWRTETVIGFDVDYQAETPKRPADKDFIYTFSHWDKSLSSIQKDTDVYAQYFKSVKEFKVTFLNYNQDELYVDYVARGNTAEYFGTIPSRPSDEHYMYRFTGWDKSLTNINEDTTITAVFEKDTQRYEVTFLNYDHTFLYRALVANGEEAVYGGNLPLKPATPQYSYVFDGWDKNLEKITKNIETKALFKEVSAEFSVQFLNYDGTKLYTDYVGLGGDAHFIGATPKRPSDQQYKYTFSGWNKEINNVRANLVVSATYEQTIQEYSVTFINYDNSVLYIDSVDYGKNAFYNGKTPERPIDEKYIYKFVGWDRELKNITADLIVGAVYEKELRTFEIVFQNYNGVFLERHEVKYGDTAVYFGETPIREPEGVSAYRFVGWDKELENIKHDTTFTAQFEDFLQGGGGSEKLRVVYYYNYNHTLLDVAVMQVGEAAVYRGVDPPQRKAGVNFEGGYRYYTFSSWDRADSFSAVYRSFATYAQYTTNYGEYIVTYRSAEGVLLYEDYVYPGKNSSYKGPMYQELLYQNGFRGWNQDLNNIQKCITVLPYTTWDLE